MNSTAYKPNNPNGRPAVLVEPVQVTFQIDHETLKRIDKLAREAEVPRSEMIRKIVDTFFD